MYIQSNFAGIYPEEFVLISPLLITICERAVRFQIRYMCKLLVLHYFFSYLNIGQVIWRQFLK